VTEMEDVCQQDEGEIESAIQRPGSVRIRLRTAQSAPVSSTPG